MNRSAAYCGTEVTAAFSEVRQRVHDDRAEQHGEAAALVAEHAPGDAAEQHAHHLHVQEQHALAEQVGLRHADVAQAPHADDAEEDEVVDVDEVPERGDDDGQGDRSPVEGAGRAAWAAHAPAILQGQGLRAEGLRDCPWPWLPAALALSLGLQPLALGPSPLRSWDADATAWPVHPRHHPHRPRRLGHRRRLAFRLGAAGRRGLDRRHPARDRIAASTGSTRRPPTVSGGPKRSSARRCAAFPRASAPTSSPSAASCGTSSGNVTHSLRPESIRRECEASLTPSRASSGIDLYQIHWPRWAALARRTRPRPARGGLADDGRAAPRGEGAVPRRVELRHASSSRACTPSRP